VIFRETNIGTSENFEACTRCCKIGYYINKFTHAEKFREGDTKSGMNIDVVLSVNKSGKMLLNIVIMIGWRVLFGAGKKIFRAFLMRRLIYTLSKTLKLKI
jgi:hypothetical protein